MKLPVRDYPIGHLGAAELETEAATLVREAEAMKLTGKPDSDTFQRKRRKRAQLLYGALLCACAAREMRRHRRVRVYDDLTDKQRKRVIEDTDNAATSGTHIEHIIQEAIQP